MNILSASLSYDIGKVRQGRALLAFDIDHNGHVWFIFARDDAASKSVPDGVVEIPEGDPTPITPFQVVELAQGRTVLDIDIASPLEDLSSVNPLGDQVLVAWGRAEELDQGEWERNALVYDRDGTLRRSLHLGDAIEDLQVGEDGCIWTTYTEEGYFGDSAGSGALVAWDAGGSRLYSLNDDAELRIGDDMLALNLPSAQDCWFIHCRIGSLVWLHDRRLAGQWFLAGSIGKAIAVEGDDVLIAGSWGPPAINAEAMQMLVSWAADNEGRSKQETEDMVAAMVRQMGGHVEAPKVFTLVHLKLHPGGRASIEGEFVLRTREGDDIDPVHVRGRGNRLFVLAGETLHEVALSDVVCREI